MTRGGKLKIFAASRNRQPGLHGATSVEIGIRDTGPGMEEETKSRIFEPFFSTKEEGIGLGLPIAQRIVEEHRGEIRVESGPGEGTTFYITLPLS
jgi:signal transduction histidine kinase